MSDPASPAEIVQYPLLPLRDVVVFPHMVIALFVGRPKSMKAMETAMEAGKSILLVAQKSAAKDDPGPGDMYSIGCVSNILQMLKLPDGTVKVLVEGGSRAHIREVVDVKSHWIAEATAVPLDGTPAPEVEAMRRAHMPKDARKKAEAELKKLKLMSPMSAEATVVRNYIETIVNLPWKKKSKISRDIKAAQEILDKDHYGLEKVKERIVEYLAVQTRVDKMKAPILCLVGAPGVGKTSLGQSIARATNRKFVRLSLGGVRDEAEIRGHRRTYVGALPGRIIQSMKKAATVNPVMMLDEIDKLGADFRGDPSAALLEVLDPEQNNSFSDHYLDVPYDLSKI